VAQDVSKTAYFISVQDVVEQIGTDLETGLEEAEAKKRIESHGRNRLRRQKKKSALSILAHQFKSIIVWLLSAAAVMSFVLGNIAEGFAIACVRLRADPQFRHRLFHRIQGRSFDGGPDAHCRSTRVRPRRSCDP